MGLTCAQRLFAAERVTDFSVPVAPGSATTYAQLAATVFGDSGRDPASGAVVTTADKALRQPGTRQRVTLPAGARIEAAEVLRVRGDGRRNLVILWEAAAEMETPGNATVLAVFPEGAVEPTDVVSVQTDTMCDTDDGRLLAVGPDEAFFIRNGHNNSNQTYLDTGLFHIVDGRLRRIADVFTLAVRADDCRHSFAEALIWKVTPTAGAAYPAVTATVRLIPETGCRSASKPQAYAETYVWDAANKRFRPKGQGFARLDAFNQALF